MSDEELDTPDPEQPEEPHADDGLDLARSLTRATAGSTPRRKARMRGKDRPASPRSRVSGAHPDDRDPQTLDSTLARLVDDRGWELDLRMRGVFAMYSIARSHWPVLNWYSPSGGPTIRERVQ